MELQQLGERLTRRLPELLAEHEVPAGSLAVSVGEEVVEVAAGTLSLSTHVEATTDSLFQIGSVTKVWTATLVMQLVEEGRVELDAPAQTYLPSFMLGDSEAAGRVTVRQLLCHTAGFEGDIFTDTGKGDDCIEAYVALLADAQQLYAPGEMFSYNNAGYCVLGRLVEVLRGRPFDACLREHLIEPLGLTHVACDPYEAIVFRAAVGHPEPAPGRAREPTSEWAMARSNAPAGSMLAMRPRDLLAFARMHIDRGCGPTRRVLSAAGVAAMQRPQVALPDIGWGTAWGLGWEIDDLPDGVVVGHNGSTIGQQAFLRLVPERGLALAICTNGGRPGPVQTEIAAEGLRELAAIELPVPPTPTATASLAHPERYLGRYRSRVSETRVEVGADGRLWLERRPLGLAADLGDLPHRTQLVAWRGDSLLPLTPEQGRYDPIAFLGDDGEGRARFLHAGRAEPRVA